MFIKLDRDYTINYANLAQFFNFPFMDYFQQGKIKLVHFMYAKSKGESEAKCFK